MSSCADLVQWQLAGESGSGKFATPCERIHLEKTNSCCVRFACCAGVIGGGPPPGMSERHAAIAAFAFAGVAFWMTMPRPPGLSASTPCAVMHVANAVKLGFSDGVAPDDVAGVVVSRLATDGGFDPPPQPAASTA